MKLLPLTFGIALAEFTSGTSSDTLRYTPGGCGQDGRRCIRNKDDCNPHNDDGCALVSLVVSGDKLNVTLAHRGADSYVAVGFAPGSSMANADITYCQHRGSSVGIVSAFATRNGRPDDMTIVDYANVETAMSTGGGYECHFQKELSIVKAGQEFKFDTESYHVLLAKGAMNGNEPGYHGIGNVNRLATSQITLGNSDGNSEDNETGTTPNDATEGEEEETNDNDDVEIVSDDEMADHDDHSGHGHAHDAADKESSMLTVALSALLTVTLILL